MKVYQLLLAALLVAYASTSSIEIIQEDIVVADVEETRNLESCYYTSDYNYYYGEYNYYYVCTRIRWGVVICLILFPVVLPLTIIAIAIWYCKKNKKVNLPSQN